MLDETAIALFVRRILASMTLFVHVRLLNSKYMELSSNKATYLD